MTLDADHCYAALTARDRRFDGLFFVGVRTTGIYCRPVCTARTPRPSSCEFFDSAARAEKAGFRACFRCRPEVAPGYPTNGGNGVAAVDASAALVARAVARIHDGALNESGVDELAAELGVTDRHLRRTLEQQLGVTPVELAQARRVALAKALLQDSRVGLAEVAFASGFGSVRRFNAVFQDRFGRAPSSFRKEETAEAAPAAAAPVTLRLDYRPPLDHGRLLAFLAARAIPGVEVVEPGGYRRVVHLRGRTGVMRARFDVTRPSLALEVAPQLLPVLMSLVGRVRRLFDLDARPDAIEAVLAQDPRLARYVAARPGLRVPGTVDPFEAGVRALLGQQVSVRAATTLAGRFAERFGTPLDQPEPGLLRRFPTAAEVAASTPDRIQEIGLTKARAASLHGFAAAVAERRLRLDPSALPSELDEFVAAATALPGIGDWTAHYLAMRALHHPDAFPAGDLGVKKALGGAGPKEATRAALGWRPWRAYAVIHLWTGLGEEGP